MYIISTKIYVFETNIISIQIALFARFSWLSALRTSVFKNVWRMSLGFFLSWTLCFLPAFAPISVSASLVKKSTPGSFKCDREDLKMTSFLGLFPSGNYMFIVNNRNTRTRCEICSKLTIKIPERRHWRRSGVFIVNFEHISYLFLVFQLLTLSRWMQAGLYNSITSSKYLPYGYFAIYF